MDIEIDHQKMVRAAKKRATVLLNNGELLTLTYWPIPASEYRGTSKSRHGSKPTGTLCNTDTPNSVYITFEPEEILAVWTVNQDGEKEMVEWNPNY